MKYLMYSVLQFIIMIISFIQKNFILTGIAFLFSLLNIILFFEEKKEQQRFEEKMQQIWNNKK